MVTASLRILVILLSILEPEGRWLRASFPIPWRTASQKKCRSNPVPAIASTTENAQIRGEPLLRLLSNSVSVSYITANYLGFRLRSSGVEG